MITFYQAFVEVRGCEHTIYWTKLGTPKTTRAEAQADITSYHDAKRDGTHGYRKGAPGRTRIDEKTV
jgi:hypothetical protein